MISSLFATVVALSLSAPAEPGAAGGPNIVAQAQPVSRWIADMRAFARMVNPGDPKSADKAFEDSLKETFGEKGFEGLDLDRAFGLYGTLAEVPTESTAVLAIPITGKAEFLEFLGRLPPRFQADEEKGKPGLYRIVAPLPIFLRISEQTAYISINSVDGSVLDAEKLLPLAKYIDPAESANVVIRAFPATLPGKLIRQQFAQIDQFRKGALKGNGPRGFGVFGFMELIFLSPLAALTTEHVDAILNDGKEASLRLNISPTSELSAEVAVVPKAGTKLAASIAGYTPGRNRFAGLIPEKAAVGVQLKLPTSLPHVQEMTLDILKLIETNTKGDAPPPLQPLLDEFFKGLARTAKAGDFDLAAALTEPGERGFSHIQGAAVFDDTAELEKAFRKLFPSLPDSARAKEIVTFDVAKVNGVNLHILKIGREMSSKQRSIFSEDALLCLAFAPKSIHFALGADPIPLVKASLEPKANDASLLAVTVNVNSLYRLIQAGSVPEGKRFKEMFGDENRTDSVLSLSTRGGTDFRVKLALNPRYMPRAMAVPAEPPPP